MCIRDSYSTILCLLYNRALSAIIKTRVTQDGRCGARNMQIHFQEVIIMNKNTFTTVKLAKGEMNIYDFGGIKLHAYKTNDFIDDEVFVVEKNGKAVIIESPCFFDKDVYKRQALPGSYQ